MCNVHVQCVVSMLVQCILPYGFHTLCDYVQVGLLPVLMIARPSTIQINSNGIEVACFGIVGELEHEHLLTL